MVSPLQAALSGNVRLDVKLTSDLSCFDHHYASSSFYLPGVFQPSLTLEGRVANMVFRRPILPLP